VKLRIGIDVDGCVYHWTKAVNEALADKFEVEGLEEHTHWDYLQEHVSKQQWEWVWSADAAEMVFGRLDMIFPGAKQAVNQLCQDHEVHFVTHRHPRRVGGITGHWLRYHFRNYTGVHVIHNRCEKHTLGTWDVFVDDKPSTVEEFLENTEARVLMPVRPYNEHLVDSGRLFVFDHWDEVPGLVEGVLA
jgi:5'(3')-deoxyribonucleotidase